MDTTAALTQALTVGTWRIAYLAVAAITLVVGFAVGAGWSASRRVPAWVRTRTTRLTDRQIRRLVRQHDRDVALLDELRRRNDTNLVRIRELESEIELIEFCLSDLSDIVAADPDADRPAPPDTPNLFDHITDTPDGETRNGDGADGAGGDVLEHLAVDDATDVIPYAWAGGDDNTGDGLAVHVGPAVEPDPHQAANGDVEAEADVGVEAEAEFDVDLDGLVDVNGGDADLLAPYVGADAAIAIADNRDVAGPFHDVTDLLGVDGIRRRHLLALAGVARIGDQPLVTVPSRWTCWRVKRTAVKQRAAQAEMRRNADADLYAEAAAAEAAERARLETLLAEEQARLDAQRAAEAAWVAEQQAADTPDVWSNVAAPGVALPTDTTSGILTVDDDTIYGASPDDEDDEDDLAGEVDDDQWYRAELARLLAEQANAEDAVQEARRRLGQRRTRRQRLREARAEAKAARLRDRAAAEDAARLAELAAAEDAARAAEAQRIADAEAAYAAAEAQRIADEQAEESRRAAARIEAARKAAETAAAEELARRAAEDRQARRDALLAERERQAEVDAQQQAEKKDRAVSDRRLASAQRAAAKSERAARREAAKAEAERQKLLKRARRLGLTLELDETGQIALDQPARADWTIEAGYITEEQQVDWKRLGLPEPIPGRQPLT